MYFCNPYSLKHPPGTDVKLGELQRLESATVTSFINTFIHFIFYIPAMLVVGLHGFGLPPVVILLCDFLVYGEFLVHPTMLLIGSTKMRQEITHSIKKRLCCRRFATTPPHCTASNRRMNQGLSRFQWLFRSRRCRPSLTMREQVPTPVPEPV
ncbi:unnamed protein product [Notodromas monacha]|uniref:Uncharacterized protein n=1 Tax=Notodromas monacha TaxID=399045 RepID=A0A7R9C1N0_9CRUS|nr:unnamed protein product [Notodromas monacha]CAG0924652.1 unnamed protein product [Notodromas monacha]